MKKSFYPALNTQHEKTSCPGHSRQDVFVFVNHLYNTFYLVNYFYIPNQLLTLQTFSSALSTFPWHVLQPC